MKLGAFFTGGIVAGTVRSYKAIVAGALKTIDELVVTLLTATTFIATNFTVTSLTIGATAVDATGTELNRAADMSTRVVNLAVSTAITELAHDGKTIVMGGAGSARTFTLPVPVAGMKFRFIVGAVNTSGYLIKSVAGTHVMGGTIFGRSDNSAAVLGYTAGATDDTITLDGTTKGGVSIGDWVQVEALSATQWAVTGLVTMSGTEATPFSDTVT